MKLAWLPAEKHSKLNEYQVKVLTGVANREDKSYIALIGEPGSTDENDRNILFNDFLKLIELGMFLELDREDERYVKMQAQFEQKGMVLVIGEMTNRGWWMWEQTPWEKWVN